MEKKSTGYSRPEIQTSVLGMAAELLQTSLTMGGSSSNDLTVDDWSSKFTEI